MNDKVEDKKTGISLRFIREYDPRADLTRHDSVFDRALALCMLDERPDVPLTQRFSDALVFIRWIDEFRAGALK